MLKAIEGYDGFIAGLQFEVREGGTVAEWIKALL